VAPGSCTRHWSVVARVVATGIPLPGRFGRMAAIRAIERGEVCRRARSLMAGLASCGVMRDSPPRVSKCRSRPGSGVVACRARACRRESISRVVRYLSAQGCGTHPLGYVATVTIGRRDCGSEVAQVAGRRNVRSGQGETGSAVVKDSAEPIGCRVARRASGWIRQGHVVRSARIHSGVCRVLIICGVATVASGWQRAAVVAVHMAQSASNCGVRARQRERSGAVVERRCRPVRSRMADRAICGEPGRNVIRNRPAERRRAVPFRGVATVTGRGTERVIVAHVARRTRSGRRRNVHARQRKTCRAVIERRCCKAHGGVAIGAVGHCE
jgi:hypothetical protein